MWKASRPPRFRRWRSKRPVAKVLGSFEYRLVRPPRFCGLALRLPFRVDLDVLHLAGIGRFRRVAALAFALLLFSTVSCPSLVSSSPSVSCSPPCGCSSCFLFALFLLALVRLLGHFQRAQQIAHEAAKRLLIARLGRKLLQRLAAALLQERPPHIRQRLRSRRRRLPCQLLANDQRQRLVERRVLARRHIRVSAMSKVILALGRKIIRHPIHAVGADRLHPRPLNRFEHRARLTRLWRELAMQLFVMASERQRQAVRPATHDGDLALDGTRAGSGNCT